MIFMSGLDVIRTDRTLVFYEKQENLSRLWDILAVYAWTDIDVGYCQGGYKSIIKEGFPDYRSSVCHFFPSLEQLNLQLL